MADLGILGKAPSIQASETDDSSEANSVLDEDEKKFEAQKREQIIRELKQDIDERHEEHELRKEFLHTIYTFVSTVVFAALLLTFFSAAGMIRISDSVLIALLTTTIANVIGCLLIAFNWLFPNRASGNSQGRVKG